MGEVHAQWSVCWPAAAGSVSIRTPLLIDRNPSATVTKSSLLARSSGKSRAREQARFISHSPWLQHIRRRAVDEDEAAPRLRRVVDAQAQLLLGRDVAAEVDGERRPFQFVASAFSGAPADAPPGAAAGSGGSPISKTPRIASSSASSSSERRAPP